MRERKYPVIVVFKEKHGDAYYLANNEDEFFAVFNHIFLERYTAGYWYTDEDFVQYAKDPDDFTGYDAFQFLNMHSDGEYEGYEIENPITVSVDEEETANSTEV